VTASAAPTPRHSGHTASAGHRPRRNPSGTNHQDLRDTP
jgi:hypothetical protein